MEVGTQVWSNTDSGDDPWILSEVTNRTATSLTLKYIGGDNKGKTLTRPLLPASKDDDDGAKYQGVEMANAPLSDADIADGADSDMISLQHLHEPAILHAVSERYFRGEIYTWTGPVLIAVNPFQRLPLYTRVSSIYTILFFLVIF
jgi:myosin heavy subunit